MSGYRLLDLFCACFCRCKCGVEREELYGERRRDRVARYRADHRVPAIQALPREVAIDARFEVTLAFAATYLNTGDVILFASKDAVLRRRAIGCRRSLTANCIRATTGSPFTHVGVVIKCIPGAWLHADQRVVPLNDGAREQLYLWHAPSTDVASIPDQITGMVKSGPQLTPFEQAMRAYSRSAQDVYVRAVHHDGVARLDERPNAASTWSGARHASLMAFLRETAQKAYKSDAAQLLRAVYDVGPLGVNKADYREYFCSELVAHTLMKLGMWHDYDRIAAALDAGGADRRESENLGDMQQPLLSTNGRSAPMKATDESGNVVLVPAEAATPPNEYVPADFTRASGTRLPWLPGYSLNKKKLIVL